MCAGLRNFRALFQQFIADRAVGVASVTGCRKRCFDRIANLRLVASSRDHFNSGDRCAANRAFDARRMTGLGAGSGLFRNINRGMPGCIDCFGLGCIANCAGVGLDTGVLTGRGGRDLALIPAVALCRNGFTLLLYFITNLAIGIAGVAFLSAGRLTATTNLGQRVVIRPAGFEGQVGEGIEPCVTPLFIFDLKRVIETVAHGSGDEPTGEVIAFTGEGAFGKRVAHT